MTHNKKYHSKRQNLMGYVHPQIQKFKERWGDNYIPQRKPNLGLQQQTADISKNLSPSQHCDGKYVLPSRETDNFEDYLGIGSMMPEGIERLRK